ncbi:MAG TPA: MFS transporter [Gaiellaceae bacterium]|nr:MFS transporter [Gaiellaceae bacterium]
MLRDRSLLALTSAELVSTLGSQFSALALPWFVLVTTHSSTRMGVVFAAELVPFVLFGLHAGVVVDRLGPRGTMLLSDVARAPVIAVVPFLHAVGGLSYPIILAVAFVHGLFSTAYFTCQRAVIPAIVGADEQSVARANSLVEGATNFTNFVGPGLAGVLIAFVGATNVMWIDAVSYVASFVLVGAFVRVVREVRESDEPRGVRAGIAYIAGDRFVRRAIVTPLLFGAAFPLVFASFPVIAFRDYHHNPRVAGLLLAAYGGGSVIGSFVTYMALARLKATTIGIAACVGLGAPFWLFVPHVPLAVMVTAIAIVGFANPMANAPIFGILTTRVPPAVFPQVVQTIIVSNQVVRPAAYATAGVLFTSLGLHAVYAIAAVLATAASTNFILAILAEGPGLAQETA